MPFLSPFGTIDKPIGYELITSARKWVIPRKVSLLLFILISGGAGGGSGRKGAPATARYGGGGGSAGAVLMTWVPASFITGPLSFTIGGGGTGGASIVANSTNGNTGQMGGATECVFTGPSGSYPGRKMQVQSGTYGFGGTASSAMGGGGPSGVWAGAAGGSNSGFNGGQSVGTTTTRTLICGGSSGTSIDVTDVAGTTAGSSPPMLRRTGTFDTLPSWVDQMWIFGTGGGGGTPDGAEIDGKPGSLFGAGGGGGAAGTDEVSDSGKGGDGAQGCAVIFMFK